MLLTNIRQFTDLEVILLFKEKDFTVPLHFRNKWGCSVFTFADTRDDRGYIANIRPWLLWQYFEQNPAAQAETYFYIDSDIIFREWIDFSQMKIDDKIINGSDVDGYIGYDYIEQCKNGPEILAKMAEICGTNLTAMEAVPGIGAHLVLKNTRADFWKRCYYDSNKIYHYLSSLDSNIQKWTSEMWAQQWGWVREGYELLTPKELDFCRPTDPVAEYDTVKILHNAGVVAYGDGYFFKGLYDKTSPIGMDFSDIRTDKATIKYVEAIKNVNIRPT